MAEAEPQDLSILDDVIKATSISSQLSTTSTDVETPIDDKLVQQRVEDARSHVELIRQERGVDEDIPDEKRSRNFQDLRASCDVVSDQLNTEDTHFVLEFIQNADDNNYALSEGEVPTLTFDASPGKLHITCNEIGFQHENVEAICNLGRSSKSSRASGFIGEKGLGFKSVFKIARVVHIKSREYTFKFDSEALLGIVTPVWSTFPVEAKEGHTNFLLELALQSAGQLSEKQLRLQLRGLDHALLLFLRKLRQISILSDDGCGIGGKWTRHIRREDQELYGGQMVTIGEHKKRYRKLEDATDYMLVRHIAEGMPLAKRRAGITTSEVVLAFSFKNSKPTFFKRKAYAFLPIRESGFRFLIQADFLLNAAREDVLINDWNQALLNALAQCFHVAVERFNQPGAIPLRYTWPGFLQNLPTNETDFFTDLGQRIFETLKYQPVLESRAETFVRPVDAVFVPKAYRQGTEFILDALDKNAAVENVYISSRYQEHDPKLTVLTNLGVNIMDFSSFLNLLAKRIAYDLEGYKQQEPSWHSALAQILCKVSATEWNASIKELNALNLIPLHNGEWVSVDHGRKCYFDIDASNGAHRLPEGLEAIYIVQDDVTTNDRRCELLTRLGVKRLDRVEVCRLISACHTDEYPPELTLDDIMFHAQYIFESQLRFGLTIAKPKRFWVHDASGTPRHAPDVYCDTIEPLEPRISHVLPIQQWSSRLLHPAYTQLYSPQQMRKWMNWLETTLEIPNVLHIVDAMSRFTSEFQFLLETLPSGRMLDYLVSAMHKKSAELTPKPVKDAIRALTVSCEGNYKFRLEGTFLPSSKMRKAASLGLPFLILENVEATRWRILKDVGVIVDPGLDFYLRCLEITSRLPHMITAINATELYKQIELEMSRVSGGAETVRKLFERPMIYIYTRNTWCSKSNCVWKPIPGVDEKEVLSGLYPNLQSFFVTNLLIDNGTIEMIVLKLMSISQPGQDDDNNRKPLLYALNDFLREKPNDYSKLRPLENVPVMPIASKLGLVGIRLASLNKATWCFSDIHDYYESFEGLDGVNFADFDIDDFPKVQHLADAIKAAWPVDGQRRLSLLVKRTEDFGSDIRYSMSWTAILREKLQFLRRIVRVGAGTDSARKLKALDFLRVFEVPNLAYTTRFNRGQLGRPVIGRPVKRTTFHKYVPGGDPELSLYVRLDTSDSVIRDGLSEEICRFTGVAKGQFKSLTQKIFLHDSASEIYDMLLRAGIEAFEKQPYTPPPVPVSQSFDVPAESRLPLKPISANTIAQAAVPLAPARTVDDLENLAPAAASMPGNDNSDTELPQASRMPGTTLGAHEEIITGRTADNARRMRELPNGGVQIGGLPQASKVPSDAHNYRDLYDDRPTAQQRATLNGNGHVHNASRPTGDRQRSSPPPTASYREVKVKIKSKADLERELSVGIDGECAVWNLLNQIFGDSVNESWWTSELRSHAKLGLSRWRPENVNATYCDFTVQDAHGLLTKWLLKENIAVPPARAGVMRTYHIEVKSTTGPSNETCHMSQLQMKLCEDLCGGTENIFLLLRVYGLYSAQQGIRVYADPWNLVQEGQMMTREAEAWLLHFHE